MLFVSCKPTYRFHQTGAAYEPRPANCSFRVFATAPASPYEEIGVIEISSKWQTTLHADVDQFRTAIAPQVCEAGGNGVIAVTAVVGGVAGYIKGIVVVLEPVEQPKKKPKSEASSEEE